LRCNHVLVEHCEQTLTFMQAKSSVAVTYNVSFRDSSTDFN
jgi:hypothetical protein